jgi:hypothetical protein
MQNIEQHGEARRLGFPPAAFGDEVPLLHSDILEAGLRSASGGRRHHEWIDVDRVEHARYSLRSRDRERTVAAAKLDGVAFRVATAEGFQGAGGIEIRFPLLDRGHAGVATHGHLCSKLRTLNFGYLYRIDSMSVPTKVTSTLSRKLLVASRNLFPGDHSPGLAASSTSVASHCSTLVWARQTSKTGAGETRCWRPASNRRGTRAVSGPPLSRPSAIPFNPTARVKSTRRRPGVACRAM